MLAYIIAALVWWCIELGRQNTEIISLKQQQLISAGENTIASEVEISALKKRKIAQYVGEGSIFLLLIVAAAIYVYRAVNRQLKQSIQQQNFMMAITHELKTPISVAQLNLETLIKRKLEAEQQQRLIKTTLQEINRLNSLCNNILITSQFDAGGYKLTRENISVDHMAEKTINDYRLRYPDRKIDTSIEKDVMMQGDELLLQMAINNLLDNAIKYSPKDRCIFMKISKHPYLTISVNDEGDGIHPEERTKVFEKYYRVGNEATRSAKGTGLGLYLTERIVTAHKGNITLDENKPKGCSFTITFPQNT
jgi:signal transduction histidine kinase